MYLEFTPEKLSKENLDTFHIRQSIFNSLAQSTPSFTGKLLDVGCGKMPYKSFILQNSTVDQYIGLDIETARVYDQQVQPDYFWDGTKMPFEDNYFDTSIATEVLEHCPDPKLILNEIYRILRPNGKFFFTIPFLWNLHEIPYDEYRYTPFAIKRLLEESGFTEITIKIHGGWHASLAQMLGLWVKRAPISRRNRMILAKLSLPIIKFLLKKDKQVDWDISKPLMITGISGLANKH